MKTMKVAIVGAGGHAQVVASTLIAAGHEISGFFVDDSSSWGKMVLGYPVSGPTTEISSSNCSHAIIGIGDNAVRQRVSLSLNVEWAKAVHPFSWVHPGVELGPGTIVCAGAIVQAGSVVGSHVILNTKASVDHDCRVGDFVHVAVAHMAGGASAAEGAFLALGSTILPGIHVGAWATVGAGAVVTKDVEARMTVVGIPARPISSKGLRPAS